jgi:hypothetical protein
MGPHQSQLTPAQQLHLALHLGLRAPACSLLESHPRLANAPLTLPSRSPAFLVAVKADEPAIVELVVRLGADVSGRDAWGRDAAIVAVVAGCRRSLALVVQRGWGDLGGRCRDGLRAVDYAVLRGCLYSALILLPHQKPNTQ